jgi:hypothetical protein
MMMPKNYGLGDRGLLPGTCRDFSLDLHSQISLLSSGHYGPGVEQSGCKANHSPLPNIEVKNA